jgi:hypothetical protein
MILRGLELVAASRDSGGPAWPVLPGLVLALLAIVVMVGAVIVHRRDVRNLTDRRAIFSRALGLTWNRVTTWMLFLGVALSFVGLVLRSRLT